MRNKRIKHGFTLIEIIVSLALIGLISVAFLPMFTLGTKFILMSGKRSKTNYNLQNVMENKVNDVNPDANLQFKLKIGISEYKIYGTKISIPYSDGSVNKTIIGMTISGKD